MTGRPLRMRIPQPFLDGRFPADLGVFVSPAVLSGLRPVLYIAHNEDDTWVLFDNEGDPNDVGALIVACVWHAIEHDGSLSEVATWPAGVEGVRDRPGDEWSVRQFVESCE